MRPTAGAAGRHPARHGGGKLRLEAEQAATFCSVESLAKTPVFLVVALHPLNETRYRSPVPQILVPVPAFARYRPSEVPVEREMSAAAQDDRIGLRQTEDYCAPRRGGSGHPNSERGGLHLAGQLPAVDNCRSSSVGYRRKLTGKMKSTALGKNTFGTALPRRTIVRLTAFSRCVILGRWKMLSTPYPL